MHKTTFMLASVALISLPGLALAWVALNRHEVNQISDGVFEVVSRPGSGAADFWCGAGDYATAVLRVSATQRVYLWAARGASVSRPGAKAVQFSLSVPPSGPAPQSYSLSVKAVGDSLTAAAARQYCYGNIKRPF